MANDILLWGGFNLFVLALLAIDLRMFGRSDKAVSVRVALLMSLVYVALSLIFAFAMCIFRDVEAGTTFLTAYLMEKSLSLDNLFVFAMIFYHFSVPPALQHRVLFWGILGALVLRGFAIFFGIWAISHYPVIMIILGGLLIYTGLKMLVSSAQQPHADIGSHKLVRTLRAYLPLTSDFQGTKFFVKTGGRRLATPLFMVLILVEVMDIVFAIDSIPAVFAITLDPFIVYTSNVFAILGLRSLYFVMAASMKRFHYIKYGLALLLPFIGMKMIVTQVYGAPLISPHTVFWVAFIVLGCAVGVSWVYPLSSGGKPLRKTEK